MSKVHHRFFEVSPSWAGAASVGLKLPGNLFPLLTSAICFAGIKALYNQPIPTTGEFWFKKRPKAIPDFVWATGNVAIVTPQFKSVVESLAPTEAEFLRFSMTWPDGENVAGEWYLMNVLNLVDCFDFDRMGRQRPPNVIRSATGEKLEPLDAWLQMRFDQHRQSPPIYVDPIPIGGFKIFRPLFRSNSLFCAGDLVQALKDAGVRRLRVERLGTRDDPIRNPLEVG